MTQNTPRTPLPVRTANARREVAYWAGRACRTALRAIQRAWGGATFWSISGWPLLIVGLSVLAHSALRWNHANAPPSGAVFGGLYSAAGIVLLYFHGEAKRRGRG